MPDQLEISEHQGPQRTIAVDFRIFDQVNPQVYRELRRLARVWIGRRGVTHLGIATLYEVTRWNLSTGRASARADSPEFMWAVGLFEGEGTFASNGCRRMTFSSTDKDVVDRFHGIIGVGRVYGPYKQKRDGAVVANRLPFWRWNLDRWPDLSPLVEAMLPHLSERRKAAAQAILDNPAQAFGYRRLPPEQRPIMATVKRVDGSGIVLNNNHRALYARKLMHHEWDLAGLFETRKGDRACQCFRCKKGE